MSTRHAALLLHALSEADRAWLWERLSDSQRNALQPLLLELGELGIARDPALVRQVLARAPGAAVREALSPIDELDRLPAVRVAALLAQEPRAFVLQLISLRQWRWGDEIVRSMALPAVDRPGAASGERFVWHAAKLIVERARVVSAQDAPQADRARPAQARLARGRRAVKRLLWGAAA